MEFERRVKNRAENIKKKYFRRWELGKRKTIHHIRIYGYGWLFDTPWPH